MLHGSTYHIKTSLFCVIEDVELLYTCYSINLVIYSFTYFAVLRLL